MITSKSREMINLVIQALSTKDAKVCFPGSHAVEMLNAWNSENTQEMADYQQDIYKACSKIAKQKIKFRDKHNKHVILTVIDKDRRYHRLKRWAANLYEIQELKNA